MIYLVHHADAVLPAVDPSRPLSDAGRASVELVALETARRGAKPECIWHSGKLRARQTAEAFWRACNPFAAISAERGLQPGDPPHWMRDRLAGEVREVMIVGHMPNIAHLLRVLVGEDAVQPVVTFPLHGLVTLEPEHEWWVERWRVTTIGE